MKNTKKIFAGICTCLILMAASCTPNDSAEDQQLYDHGVDKTKITKGPDGVDKTKITKGPDGN